MARGLIALLSDFGTRDGYAAAMKGVLARGAPDAAIVDITHDVPPGDILHGAWVLATVWRHFPDGAVFLCVVDPGVGSERRAVAIEAGGRVGVGPDNGIFSFVIDEARAVAIAPREDASPVFHGRDVFAPVAAALARGMRLEDVGESVADLQRLPLTRPLTRPDGVIESHIVHVDRFGNCITDVPADLLAGRPVIVETGGRRSARFVRFYAEGRPGELVALVNSADHLELALRGGSASERLGIGRGDAVLVLKS